MGELSGILLLSGTGLIAAFIGMAAFLWGKRQCQLVALPLAFLIFMVPLPSYMLGMISWRLQAGASTVSTGLLQRLGIPVFQDGNLLVLPNYVLTVKEACSGTRSVFALMALAVLLGVLNKGRWVPRLLLFASAPGIALLSNIIRIVGTGLAAYFFGEVAVQETLHVMWGIIVFVIGVAGLLGMNKGLQWASERFASVS
jgi:exosortase